MDGGGAEVTGERMAWTAKLGEVQNVRDDLGGSSGHWSIDGELSCGFLCMEQRGERAVRLSTEKRNREKEEREEHGTAVVDLGFRRSVAVLCRGIDARQRCARPPGGPREGVE